MTLTIEIICSVVEGIAAIIEIIALIRLRKFIKEIDRDIDESEGKKGD